MAGAVEVGVYKDALLLLGTAAVVAPFARRLHITPIFTFMLAGALLGPNGLGQLIPAVPQLSMITLSETQGIRPLAELGIVFLLFLIALELSLERLTTMWRLVFGLGGLQMAISIAVIAGIASLFDNTPAAAVVLGSCLALSSTAVVVELLAKQKRLASTTGRLSFAVLLFQDLAVVPILFVVGILSAGNEMSLASGLGLALMQGAFVIGLIVVAGRLVLRPLFGMVAKDGSSEFFIAATLLVAVGTGVVTAAFGLSMALGAFVAGLLLAETEYRRAIEAVIEPFKSLLLGLFFFSVGLEIDIREVIKSPVLLLGSVVGLIAIKAGIFIPIARAFGSPWPTAIRSGLLLGTGGEFAFVVLALAVAGGVVPAATGDFMLMVAALSMAILPLLDWFGRRITRNAAVSALPPEASIAPPPSDGVRALVVGYGRVGQLMCDMLARHGIPHLVVDSDPNEVARMRRKGKEVFFGDATNREFLEHCNIGEIQLLIVTVHTNAAIETIVSVAKSIRPDLHIVARARDAAHARRLYALGVTDAVPETIEASLQLSEAALLGLGVPLGYILPTIHERREEFRKELLGDGRDGKSATYAGRRGARA
jgi:CPA2 family monovalent cation:H+ antiporter-2